MRVYFLSGLQSALKLNGIFLGFISSFERFVDLSLSERIFAEVLPENSDFYSLSFVLDENFFKNPPDFCDVYNFDGGAIVEITSFPARIKELKVIKQERLGDALFTLYSEGDLKLSVESPLGFSVTTLPFGFENGEFSVEYLGGEKFFTACFEKDNEKLLLIFTNNCEKAFVNKVLNFSFGQNLEVKLAYNDPVHHIAKTTWQWQNGFKIRNYEVYAEREIDIFTAHERLIPILFFNEVLVCGTPEKYLCDALKPRSGEFKEYLGEFISVCQPPEIFSLLHPNKICAGLIFAKSPNRYEIKFFGVTLENNLISNVFPVQ